MSGRRPPRVPVQVRWIWVAYIALFAASVPWYLPDGPVRLWFGLPYWVVVSIAAIGGVALLTVFVLNRYWVDEEDPG